ncbi:putative oxidoreductase,short chain dehydrogenase [Lasiosphaeria hispida]|uniref:Oxidoreductase,short chain dehydrogenase n=1 Tax=Lasiosphaeria hispida TaxID=260671 RepID=A0AAJ0HB17_9PEZI|nr:putative oxidoreductase,short chain dehydrogenase [Lasiosphaeria hispida]
MTEIIYSETLAQQLQGRVVVMTGGAQGIGAATVTRLHGLGAHVFFGDWDAAHGTQLESSLRTKTSPLGGTAHFRQLDVRDYSSQLALFDAAYQAHGQVDIAISCAAVKEPSGYVEPSDLDLASVREEPTAINDAMTINLTSVLHFTRLALAHMKASPATPFTRSITLISSIAGITEAPGLFAYAAAKHGVIGLMRALRPWAPVRYGVRVNAICPWATDTQLLSGVKDRWATEKMPLNTPDDVARQIVQSAADATLNGTAVFVTGGRGFDTEDGVDRCRPQWMGEDNAAEFDKGQKILGLVSRDSALFCLGLLYSLCLVTDDF